MSQHGFLLYGDWAFQNGKQVLTYWGKGPEGPFKLTFPEQKDVFFIDRSASFFNSEVERKSVGLKSMSGIDVDALYFTSSRQKRDVEEKLKSSGVRTFEVDIRLQERFLMERFINASVEFTSPQVQEGSQLRTYHQPQIRPSSFRPQLSSMSLDIETGMDGVIYSIGYHFVDPLRNVESGCVHMVGHGPEGSCDDYRLIYYPTEREALIGFMKDFHQLDPDLIIGWNIVGFDLRFMERRANDLKVDFLLGREEMPHRLIERKGMGWFARIPGRVVLDGVGSLRAAFYRFESFKLDNVAKELLGVGKDIGAESGAQTSKEKVAEIERRFREDKPALAKYNFLDCKLVTEIFDHVDLINLWISRSQTSGMLFDRLNSTTGSFDFFYLPKLHRKGFVASNVVDIERDGSVGGGHVLDPLAGVHENVAVLDFKSLYPSIMRTFFIDPLALAKNSVHPVSCPAGTKFSRTENILAPQLEKLMEYRSRAKITGDSALSMATKILMNSFYGILGSSLSRFYHTDLPNSITGCGRWILQAAVDYLEENEYQVVYGDTDSVFVKLKPHQVTDGKNKAIQLAKEVDEYLSSQITRHFKVESKLELEFEKLFRVLHLPKARGSEGGAKKRYAGVVDDELVFSGMEVVRSDWTKMAKEVQQEVYRKFFDGEDLTEVVKGYIERVKNGEFDQKLIYRKRLVKDVSEYTKSIPPHVRAAKMLLEKGGSLDRSIEYVITKHGPYPVELGIDDLDYEHYLDRQLRPIVEELLEGQGTNFEELISGGQLTLF